MGGADGRAGYKWGLVAAVTWRARGQRWDGAQEWGSCEELASGGVGWRTNLVLEFGKEKWTPRQKEVHIKARHQEPNPAHVAAWQLIIPGQQEGLHGSRDMQQGLVLLLSCCYHVWNRWASRVSNAVSADGFGSSPPPHKLLLDPGFAINPCWLNLLHGVTQPPQPYAPR